MSYVNAVPPYGYRRMAFGHWRVTSALPRHSRIPRLSARLPVWVSPTYERKIPGGLLSLLLEADPPERRRARRIVTRVLTPTVLRQLKAGFLSYARRLVENLATQGSFDAIADLAEALVLRVFPDLVGLPTKGRDNLLAQSIHPYMSETAVGKVKRGRGKAGMANGYGHGVVAPMCETPRAGTLSAWLTHMLMP